MMAIGTQLFEGKLVRLAAIDHEKDPEIESRWTHDAAYLRFLGQEPARPLSPAQVKKQYEKLEKRLEESQNNFYFTIRGREDDRLLGFIRLYWIEWNHGSGSLQMGIGDPPDRGKGFGGEALGMVLQFAFEELNLYRLSAWIGDDNPAGIRFFKRFGFVEEVRRRQSLHRDGKFWDLLLLGLLAEEWRSLRPAEGEA
jgi:RimJ/RimL family protein N-acetyltransferase